MTAKFEDLRQSDSWAEYICRLGWLVENLGKAKIFVRKIPLVGSVAKIQRPSIIPPIGEIDKIARKHRALFVKLEPNVETGHAPSLPTAGKQFEADNWSLSSTRTIHLDLSQNEEEIFAKFSKDARYSIRKARRSGVEARSLELEAGNLETFYNLLKETGKRKKFWVAPFKDLQAKAEAFRDKSALILAYHNSKLVAGALILFYDRVAYYHHAASNLEGRKLLAPYLVVWEAIKLSKERGCQTLDLEGIYDPRYKIYKRFRKIGIFKKKFGGREIEYPGSFVRYYNPTIKFIFKVASKIS